MRQVPLVTCILLHCTKITVNSVYLLKGCTAWLFSLWVSQNNIASMVTVCIASFLYSSKTLQHMTDAISSFEVHRSLWTHGQFLHMKSWIPSLLLCHCPHRVWSATGVFYTGEVGILAEVSVTEQILLLPGNEGRNETVCAWPMQQIAAEQRCEF